MENEESEVLGQEDVAAQDEVEQNEESEVLDQEEPFVQEEVEQEDNKRRWLVTIIALVIVAITFLFKPTNGKKKWMIPIIAFVIVVITFIQLAFAFRRAEHGGGQNNHETHISVSERDIVEEDFEESYEGNRLHNLSRNLQEMTRALNYEMLLEVMREDFDPLVDIVQIPDFRSECWPDGDEYWCELCWFDGNDYWCESWYKDDDYDFEETMQDIAYQQLSNRLSAARGQLSTLSSRYGIAYLAIHENGAVITSGNDFYELINEDINYHLIELLFSQYAHVVVVQYNHNGRWEIPLLLANETSHIIYDYLDRNNGVIDGIAITGRIPGMTSLTYQFDIMIEDFYWEEIDYVLEWQNPRNMTFVYGIPHDTYDQFVPSLESPQEVEDFDYAEVEDDPWVNWTAVWTYAHSARTAALWIMVAIAIIIPLAKVKEFDRGYEKIRKLPIDLLAFGTFIAWVFVLNNLRLVAHNIINTRGILTRTLFSYQNTRIVYFHVLLFVALCLLGYLVHYVKDLFAARWATLRSDSLIYKLYINFFAVDLKKGQSLRIFILVFGQIFVGFVLVMSTNWIDAVSGRFDQWSILLFVLIPSYLFVVFLYARYKVAKIRRDYMHLFEITQELAAGNLTATTPKYLGYFDSLKDELVTIQNGLGHAVERALSSERMKGDLITNVSHDLKTPLTSIITYVDLLQVEGLSEERRSLYLKTLELKTERLKMLIDDLFEVSKASSGNLQLDLREVDVVMLMKQTVLGLEDRIMDVGLTLRESYPEESIRMELDGGRMHRVFENLIINMVKYAMPNTRAYIDIINANGSVKIILRNISAREINVDMNDLSERFIRGEESRTTEGSGLGLAIAKSFVELQGGTFEITIDGDLFKVIMTFKG